MELKSVDSGKTAGPRSWVEPIARAPLVAEDGAPNVVRYSGFHLYEANGSKGVFTNCDFSYSTIERCYFRGARFVDCNFTGAKIVDSNFRSVEFLRCRFEYVTVHRSQMPVSEILLNLPQFANVRRDLLQQLRANAVSIGDASCVNVLVAKELEAERDYWRGARKRDSTYYRDKYSSPGKILSAYLHSISLWVDRWFWGHGESITRLIISTLICLAFLSVIRWFNTSTGTIEQMHLGGLAVAIYDTWRLYIDLPTAAANGDVLWSTIVVLLRYLTIGLFISVLFRKFSKR